MTHTLTDRYIHAVTRTLVPAQRDDVARELRASIEDQTAARRDAGQDAERAVLEDLGDPERLAAGFADRPLHLIGPRYYLAWKRLLIVLLWIVPVSSAFGVAIGQIVSGASAAGIIGVVASTTLTVAVHVAFWTTLVFVVLERSGATDVFSPWTVDRLPDVPEDDDRLGDLIGSVVCVLLLAGAVVWDLTLGFVPGRQVSFLESGLWPVRLGMLAVVVALSLLLQVAVWAQGAWRVWSATTNAVLALAAGGILVYAHAEVGLINPAFFDAVAGESAAEVAQVLDVIAWFAIVILPVWTAIDGFWKMRRSGRNRAAA